MNYTVMGDSVNLAARLEGICKIYGLEIAIGDATRDAVRDHFATRPVDCVEVKGRTQPTIVYELLGPLGGLDPEREAFATAYSAAFASYQARDFQGALAGLGAAAALQPEDVSCGILRERCEHFLASPPPADWNGVYRLTRKS
jgi:adenylate cyclase